MIHQFFGQLSGQVRWYQYCLVVLGVVMFIYIILFQDLCRYMRGELTADKETQVIQSIIGKGLEREELRDEILVQCVRQV